MQAGRLRQAEDLFKSAFAENPRNFDAGFNLAIVCRRLGKKKTALKVHERLREMAPADFENTVALGNLYAETRQPDRAMTEYRLARRLKPEDERVHYNVGITKEELGERQEALRAYAKALRLKPDFVDAANRSARLLEVMGRANDAVRTLSKLVRRVTSPHQRSQVEFERACLLARLGRYREALERLVALRETLRRGKMRQALSDHIADLEKRLAK